jgi:DNA-binding GntR family transcriptional regulator
MVASEVSPFQRLADTPPLRHRAQEQIESMITLGLLTPGSRLTETTLAERLGVSRGPIREALQQLAQDGFVDLRPRQGAFVHMPTRKEVQDFFDVRRALEAESARLAAANVEPRAVARMQAMIEEARMRLEHGDDPSAVHQKIRFHDEVTKVANNNMITDLLRNLERRSVWYRTPFELTLRKKAWDEHQAILDAIANRNASLAMQLMSAHVLDSREHVSLLSSDPAQQNQISAS